MHRLTIAFLTACALSLTAAPAYADGGLDSQYGARGLATASIGPGGRVGPIAAAPDGSGLTSLVTYPNNGNTVIAASRFTPGGDLASPFPTTFSLTPGAATPVGIGREGDGSYIAAVNGTGSVITLEHIRSDGTMDPAYGAGGFATLAGPQGCRLDPRTLAVTPGGVAFVAGDLIGRCAPIAGAQTGLFVARIRANGMPAPFDPQGVGGDHNDQFIFSSVAPGIGELYAVRDGIAAFARSLALSPVNGDLLLGGYTNGGFLVARLTQSGMLRWVRPGIGFSDGSSGSFAAIAYAIAGDARDDGVVATGLAYFGQNPNVRPETPVARLTADGLPDRNFSSGNGNGPGRALLTGLSGNGSTARAVAVTPDGRILVGDTLFDSATSQVPEIVRVTPAGGLDPTFARGGVLRADFPGTSSDSATSLLLNSDGSIFLGADASAGGESIVGIARAVANPCTICELASKQSSLTTTQAGAFVAVLGNSTPVGFLVQRRLKGGKLATVGRIPLGRKTRGRIVIRHRLIVGSRKLRPGRYLLTLRALGPNRQVLALSRPVPITIRRGH